MKSYSQKLQDFLETDGWQIEEIYSIDLEWWADEIWKLTSTWSPNSAKAYLTWLVDPQHDGLRRKGQSVWAVGASKKFPDSSREAQSEGAVSLNKSFKQELEEFSLNLENLRVPD